MIRNQRGIALMILIAVIALSGILLGPMTWHIVETTREMKLKIDRVKAYNAAYAGVMHASYVWSNSNATEASRRYAHLDTTLSGTNVRFRTGEPANFAYFSFNLTDNANWFTSGANQRLRQFRLRNIHTNTAPTSIILTGLKVKWDPPGTALLNDIRLNNVSVIPGGGPFASDTELTLGNTDANRTRSSGALWSGTSTYLQWDSALPDPVRVTVIGTFKDNGSPAVTDSKTHQIIFWDGCQTAADCDGAGTPLGRPSLRTFSVSSTGAVQAGGTGSFNVHRTVRATLSGTVAGQAVEIIDWRELDKTLV